MALLVRMAARYDAALGGMANPRLRRWKLSRVLDVWETIQAF